MRSKQEKNAKKPRAKKQKLDFVQDYLGIRDLRNGILEMSDGRYIKILEIEPINFTLRSDEEQYNIISSFASWLKISPMRLQFKSITRKADSDKHIAMVQAELAQEDNAQCRALGEEYIKLIRDVGSREALTRRFFLVFEYEAVGRHESNDYAKIYAALQTVEHNARAYFLQCGNSIVQPKDPDEATAEILYMFYNRHSCVNEPFSSRVNRVVVDTMAAENKVIGIDPIPSIPIAHFLAPRGIDLTHHNYIIMDGRYYTILYIRGNGYPSKVRAGWMSALIFNQLLHDDLDPKRFCVCGVSLEHVHQMECLHSSPRIHVITSQKTVSVLLADEFIVSRNIVHRQHRISKIEVLISTDAANFDDDYRFSSFSLYA